MPSTDHAFAVLSLAPSGRFRLQVEDERPEAGAGEIPRRLARRLERAFRAGSGPGLLHLGTRELATELPPDLGFARELATRFLEALREVPDDGEILVPAPTETLSALAARVPPLPGAEYATPRTLLTSWADLEATVIEEVEDSGLVLTAWLEGQNPLWSSVARLTFHLAENRLDPDAPFAFFASYARGLSAGGKVRYVPLGRALEEYAGDRASLLRLLKPIHAAAGEDAFLKDLVEAGDIYHPMAWTPAEAWDFLRAVPACEAAGIVVRLPDWWKARRPPAPRLSVTLDAPGKGGLGLDEILDFDLGVTLEGERIDGAELDDLLAGAAGLRLVKGQWVEVDPERLREALAHFEVVRKAAADEGITFAEGMRLLAGAPPGGGVDPELWAATRAWSRIEAGPWLGELLADLRSPETSRQASPGRALRGSLRPYQKHGVAWLWLLTRLGLGGCLADDMGLGKTVQVISLLLVCRRHRIAGPHLIVMPASLLGNWRAELERFAPTLGVLVAHRSEREAGELGSLPAAEVEAADVVLTTYATLTRVPWLTGRTWGLVVLDEAQAIKNPAARQTRAAKKLRSHARIALTGTPIENRLGDLWSLYDFLLPGLLGSPTAFRAFTKALEKDPQRGYGPLRELVRPYLLRRLKTDPEVAPELPDKTELRAYSALTREQATLYRQAVQDLARTLGSLDGMARRGAVLQSLTRLKQILNHPAHWLGDDDWDPSRSGKFQRLAEIVESVAARQEKLLLFTQYREMTGPLSHHLASLFGRPGLVLHGGTPVKRRPKLVEAFQAADGPPFFVLSLKAGGTGLNLTAATHVVHFDRWWNPAVESQATDRAYRIGQTRSVLVHKFLCRGTVEEKIDALISDKVALADEILARGADASLTEMDTDELLDLVALDLDRALQR